MDISCVWISNSLEIVSCKDDFLSIKYHAMEFILIWMGNEAFWFVVGMEGDSKNIISSNFINLRMFPDAIIDELKPINVF